MLDLWPLLIPLVLLLLAAIHDLRRHEIPNWIGLALLFWAGVMLAAGLNPVGWVSVLAGFGLGLVVSSILYKTRSLGGGDVKLVTALGAALGLHLLVVLLVWTAIVGAVLALSVRASKERAFAYAPVLLVGYLFLLLQAAFSVAFAPSVP